MLKVSKKTLGKLLNLRLFLTSRINEFPVRRFVLRLYKFGTFGNNLENITFLAIPNL